MKIENSNLNIHFSLIFGLDVAYFDYHCLDHPGNYYWSCSLHVKEEVKSIHGMLIVKGYVACSFVRSFVRFVVVFVVVAFFECQRVLRLL